MAQIIFHFNNTGAVIIVIQPFILIQRSAFSVHLD